MPWLAALSNLNFYSRLEKRKEICPPIVYAFNSELSKSLSRSTNFSKALFLDRHFRRILTLLWKLTKFNVSLYFLFVLGDAEADANKLVADVADLDPDPVCPGPEAAVSLRICNLLILFDAISRVFFFLSKNNSQNFCFREMYEIQVQNFSNCLRH